MVRCIVFKAELEIPMPLLDNRARKRASYVNRMEHIKNLRLGLRLR